MGYNFIDSDYIVEPFTFTTTQKIHDGLPDFEFRIEGVKVLEYNSIQVNRLIIIAVDGSFYQEFDGLDTRNHLVTVDSPGLSFDDWNFDGYMDVSLWKYVGGTGNNVPHYYWLWDNEAGKFVENKDLECISDYSTLEIDKENNRLISSSRDGAWMTQTEYYTYQDGQIVLVRKEEKHFMLDQRDDWGDDYADLALIIISDLIDGELTVTQEYYVDADIP